ncbi:MAG: DNA lyase [Bacteroidetes bacterium]|nr:DNA lyase [Bacteroidota bacterium]
MKKTDRDELLARYAEHRLAIRTRLSEFRAVAPERHFYELCYCLMTPQSSALQCHAVAMELERRGFREQPFDPAPLLRSWQNGYVRFHNTKARRLLEARESFPAIAEILAQETEDKQIRNTLAASVRGIGLKEASHFLRNIGRTQVTIVDRHILRNLVRLGALPDWPASISTKRYLAIEALFEDLADTLAIPADELDLLLWQRETGFVLK